MRDIPLIVIAYLQQGIVMDQRYGLTLDGLLSSAVRQKEAGGIQKSVLDGGLQVDDPEVWDLPLARCHISEEWHWLCTGANAIDSLGNTIIPYAESPDPHRLTVRPDERRAKAVAVKIPADLGGTRGRFRPRVSPVLVTPAHALIWRAVGNPNDILDLLSTLPSIGGRRGSGEGHVLKWEVQKVHVDEPIQFAHLHEDGRLGRPAPILCAKNFNATKWAEGAAGIRPPLFHESNQRFLAVPWFS